MKGDSGASAQHDASTPAFGAQAVVKTAPTNYQGHKCHKSKVWSGLVCPGLSD